MKKLLFLSLITTLGFASTVNYENLSEEKKIVMETIDEFRNMQIKAFNYELSNYKFTNLKSSGQNFIDSLDEKNSKYNIGTFTNFVGDKNKYNINTNINFSKAIDYEGNKTMFGATVGYTNSLINSNKINGINLGLNASAYIPDFKVRINTEHKFNYSIIDYNKNFKQNYMGIIGGLDFRLHFGKKYFVEPGLRASYTYNLKSEVRDQNNSLVKLVPSFNYNIGAFLRAGILFETKNKYKLSIGYAFDKRLKNSNKYEIFSREIINKKEDNYMVHSGDILVEMLFKDKHKLSLSLGKLSQAYSATLGYNYEW